MCMYWKMVSGKMFTFSACSVPHPTHLTRQSWRLFEKITHFSSWWVELGRSHLETGHYFFAPRIWLSLVRCSWCCLRCYSIHDSTVDTHTCVSPRRQSEIAVFFHVKVDFGFEVGSRRVTARAW